MTGEPLLLVAVVAGSLIVLAGLGVVARWLAVPFTAVRLRTASLVTVIAGLPVAGMAARMAAGFDLPVTDLVIAAAMVPFGVALLVVDLHLHRLPDPIVVTGAAALLLIAGVGAVVRRDADDLLDALLLGVILLVVGYLFMVISAGAFGFGDVKVLGLVGLILGHLNPPLVMLWLLALAVATVGWLIAAPYADRRLDRSVPWLKRQIAFGPAILTAVWIVWAAVVVVAPQTVL